LTSVSATDDALDCAASVRARLCGSSPLMKGAPRRTIPVPVKRLYGNVEVTLNSTHALWSSGEALPGRNKIWNPFHLMLTCLTVP
jgi:hypothetical protein